MALNSLLILFRVPDILLSPLGFKAALVWLLRCVQAICVKWRCALCHRHPHLYHDWPLPCTSMSTWEISCVSLCNAICNGSRAPSHLSSTPVSLFNTRTAVFHSGARAGCVGIDGGWIVYLTVSNVTSNCPFSSYLSDFPFDGSDAQCSSLSLSSGAFIRCAVLSPLRLLRGCNVFPVPFYAICA